MKNIVKISLCFLKCFGQGRCWRGSFFGWRTFGLLVGLKILASCGAGELPVERVAVKNELFRQFVSQYVPLDAVGGKISIPREVKHIKLDIGLSYNAPMSQQWLSCEDDLLVFGFEPNPTSVGMIRTGGIKLQPSHGEPLDTKYLDKSFFLIPCALGLSEAHTIKFYITKNDSGCSSVYEPAFFEVEDVVEVPIFSLSDFFDLFPFDRHPVVEYIKIDAQGSDLDIVKGAGHYLSDRVVYITLEAENGQYKNTKNSASEIESYMRSIGFIRHRSGNTSDPTYMNSRFSDYVRQHPIKIYQRC